MLKINFLIILSLVLFFLTACEEQKEEEVSTAVQSAQVNNTSEVEKELIVPVEILTVVKKEISQSVRLSGVLAPNQSVDIFPEVSGKVVKIMADLASIVNKGDTLAFIDSGVNYGNFKQAEAQVLTTRNALEIAKLNLQSDKNLFATGDISKIAYDNSVLSVKSAEANLLSADAALIMAKKAYFDTRITTPIPGIISRKYVETGTMVSPAAPVYRVVEISKLKLEIGIPQNIIGKVKSGNTATITVSALDNKKFSGILSRISPQADERTGTFPAEIIVDNTPAFTLKPGMTCELELSFSMGREHLVVPEYALVKKNGNSYLYIVNNNIATLTPVQEGITAGDYTVLLSGAQSGDKIVVTGMKNLGEKTRIKIEKEL